MQSRAVGRGGPAPSSRPVAAARNGHLEVIKLLVERGADVNACRAGMTPLSHALASGQEEVAAYLRSVGGASPWRAAAASGTCSRTRPAVTPLGWPSVRSHRPPSGATSTRRTT